MAYTTIDDPSAYFKVQLYTGTGSSNAITFNDTDTDMAPDLVWVKKRDASGDHYMNDSVRGVTKKLEINSASAEETDTNSLTAFGSDGFTVGSTGAFNSSSNTFVALCWKESATAGFDIVTYTGTGSAKTESHSLSAVPHFFIVRARSDSGDANVGHQAFTYTSNDYMVLSGTAALDQQSYVFNGTAPTSSVFSVGTGNDVNGSSRTYVAYLWTEKQGFSKFGSYEGNGNADGPFIFLGFRPAWFMVKNMDDTDSWRIWDNKREDYAPGNPNESSLNANEADAEYDHTSVSIDFLSNGVKFRTTGDNVSNESFTYYAFAESPFINSNGVPNNAQ